ncbi:MAG: ribonuclease HI [Cellvibrionales bacterium TMED49]|nr:ribonuclease HI [Porticoccaceae bacterium]OUU36967.1 MAG: ribonuclease HI [Cellvibrionales bacterium TMED49]|tara:strand:+ start:1054 stop:1533 length:480 start_codon:yes stop_codon:yes gene_type:complete
MDKNFPQVEIFTDGACRGNPGPGGWGVLMRYKSKEKILYGGVLETTNNRMELTAVIEGLKALKRYCRVTVVSDSNYVLQGVQKWLPNWKRCDWRRNSKTPVKNIDLWKKLDFVMQGHEITWQWVKGHSGHAENERADSLANLGIANLADEILSLPEEDQ